MKVLMLLIILLGLSKATFPMSGNTCELNNPQIRDFIDDLAKNDLKTFIQHVMEKEFDFELEKNSFHFFIETYNNFPNINHSHNSLGGKSIIDSFITAKFKTKAGHHLSFKNWYTVWNYRDGEQLPKDFHGIPFTYKVEKKIMVNGSDERPKNICIIKPVFNFKLNFRIAHVDLDSWVAYIDTNNEHPIFTTSYRFELPPMSLNK